MGNCDSCVGGRKHSKVFDEPVHHTPSSHVEMKNEIQNTSVDGTSGLANYRILPFDGRRPTIQIPDTHTHNKPRKPYNI